MIIGVLGQHFGCGTYTIQSSSIDARLDGGLISGYMDSYSLNGTIC